MEMHLYPIVGSRPHQSSRVNVDEAPLSTLGTEAVTDDTACDAFELESKSGSIIPLSPRTAPARLIDTFAFGNKFEHEELLLRMFEMGDLVDEIHIVEGNRDFTGAPKELDFNNVLLNKTFDPWRNKIIYHTAIVPEGVKGYALQSSQRIAMHADMQIEKRYKPDDVILEGDLDEIVSRRTLKTLRHCKPSSGAWSTNIRMGLYVYSMAWTRGDWNLPTAAVFASELSSESLSLMEVSQIWPRPNKLSLKDRSPSGWHVSWTLDGAAGLAHKMFIHVEGFPNWARGYHDEHALAQFLERSFLLNPQEYDRNIQPSILSEDDVPRALVQDPDKFPNILRGVHFSQHDPHTTP